MKIESEGSNELFGDVISSYTRAQAIADGVLIDVTEQAAKAGFNFPVAVTVTLWDKYIEWTDEDDAKQTLQDTNGRLWDVLCMLHFAIKRSKSTDHLFYQLSVIPRDGRSRKAKLIKLKSTVGPGDNFEPVITIMLPDED